MLAGTGDSTPDLEYATGFRAVDPVVCLCRGSERWLVVPEMEYGRAQEAAPSRGVTVLTPGMLKLTRDQRRRLGGWALGLVRHAGLRRVVVPGLFPHGVAEALQQRGIRVRVARESLFPERAVKRPEEIRHITVAQQAAVIAMRGAIAMIAGAEPDRIGVLRYDGQRLTAERVRRRIQQILLDHDCESRSIIVAPGRQAADPHVTGTGPLHAHEAVVIDIFPRHQTSGYWGDLTRTVARGVAPAALRRMYQAVRAAQTLALQEIRPGKSWKAPHRAAVQAFESWGYETHWETRPPRGFIHGTGHGVGLAVHEAPSLGFTDGRLRAGHVVTVEPGLYDPEIGGIRIEDTVVVTATGWRYLAPCEKRFEL